MRYALVALLVLVTFISGCQRNGKGVMRLDHTAKLHGMKWRITQTYHAEGWPFSGYYIYCAEVWKAPNNEEFIVRCEGNSPDDVAEALAREIEQGPGKVIYGDPKP